MPKPRNAKFRARFLRMGEAATRKWLQTAEHHLRRQQEHVNSAKYALTEFERKAAETREQAHG